MDGISKFRSPMTDPVLMNELERRGLSEVPLFSRGRRNLPEQAWRDAMDRWDELAPDRDGPVNSKAAAMADAVAMTRLIKEKARALGADDVGIAELTPRMINEGYSFPHKYIICLLLKEEYHSVLGGALAVEMETIGVYVRCAEVSTELSKHVRGIGYPAAADHNGTMYVQAIPAMVAAGLGELGKHGSMIHREFGAGFRPAFVLTDLPLIADEPDMFGVQDYCMKCRLCENNCPPAAIPSSDDYVVTDGYKRWLTDIPTCYDASRLRDEYCHICVDVCPYVHKENGDSERRSLYKQFMGKRRTAGWRTPQWFIEDEEQVMNGGGRSEPLSRE
jgi:epoxyqueuosine reductase